MDQQKGIVPAIFKGVAIAAIVVATIGLGVVHAQGAEGKPIRLIVGQPPGGGTDSIARIVGKCLAEQMRQSVVVENRPGAGGTIGSQVTASATPDGLTIMLGEISALSISPTLYSDTVDPQKAFDPISLVAINTFALVANPSSGIKSLADLIAKAKAAPNSISYATPGNGTLQHLAAELFKSQADIAMQHIPYKGGAPATMSVLSNETPIAFIGIPPLLTYISAGKLTALAVGSSKRVRDLPDTPTFAESGFKDFDANIWYGLVAPKGTPAEAISRIGTATQKCSSDPQVKSGFAKVGVEPLSSSPGEFSSLIDSERAKWAKVIKDAKIKID